MALQKLEPQLYSDSSDALSYMKRIDDCELLPFLTEDESASDGFLWANTQRFDWYHV